MNPLLRHLPEEIYTDRLRIRVAQKGDGDTVYASIQRSKEELKKWLPFAKKEQTAAEVEQNLREAYAKFLLRQDI